MKDHLKKGKELLHESRSEIIGGLVVALVVLVGPKVGDALVGASIEIPLIVLPIALAALCLSFLMIRAIRWARKVNRQLRDLETQATAHADSLEVLEQTISLPDAIRAAEARGWKVEVTKSEKGIHHEMVRTYPDGRGEMRIGGGIEFTDDEPGQRRPEDNEKLLAALILSTARRHVDLPQLPADSEAADDDGELDKKVRALPRRSG